MVEVHGRGIRAVGAQETFEPPVGRVQAVGPVAVETDDARGFDHAFQRPGAVDAHMALVGLVILMGERPADPLRIPAGHADDQGTAGLQYTHDFACGAAVVGDVLQNFAADDDIEGLTVEGQGQGVGGRQAPVAAAMGPQAVVELEAIAGRDQIITVAIRTDGGDAVMPVGRRRVPSVAAADVEHVVAASQAGPPEISGDHGSPRGRRPRFSPRPAAR